MESPRASTCARLGKGELPPNGNVGRIRTLTHTQMHHATFGAWCRRNGAHETKSHEYLNWNEELLKPVVDEVRRIWKPFDDNVERAKERCCLALQAMLDNVRNNLQG